jgi:hypothetical protein
MKERTFYDDAFEKQLKEKSDQFKMYPSDKVWNEVHSSLHSRRKRFVAGMSFLIGGILILAGTQLISPAKNTQSKRAVTKTTERPIASLDLHPFNPSALTAGPDAANKQTGNHAQNTRAPFIALPGSGENPSGLSSASESQSPVQIKSEIEAASNSDRTANIILPAMTSGNTLSLNLKENKPAQQKLPVPADVSAVIPISEKSLTQTSHIRNDRFSWEIYITPTLNTHNISGINYQNINPTIQSVPITVVHFANVNGFVDNTAAMGYDVGGNIIYRLSKNFSLKAGLQFGLSRYFIKAYNSNGSQASATLSSYFGYISDSLTNYSLAGTANPKNPQQYQNKYYQLSIPVGIEWKVAGKGRLQFYVGATLQPSYLLNRDAYVLSSDYNSYLKDPDVFRRWNLQAGAEAFISYRIGKIRWELGPQIRYQFLSTYKNSYPLGENMTNYGIRLGFSKTIR